MHSQKWTFRNLSRWRRGLAKGEVQGTLLSHCHGTKPLRKGDSPRFDFCWHVWFFLNNAEQEKPDFCQDDSDSDDDSIYIDCKEGPVLSSISEGDEGDEEELQEEESVMLMEVPEIETQASPKTKTKAETKAEAKAAAKAKVEAKAEAKASLKVAPKCKTPRVFSKLFRSRCKP